MNLFDKLKLVAGLTPEKKNSNDEAKTKEYNIKL